MSHEITIGDASVTFEQVEVDLDYSDLYENIADAVRDEAQEAVRDYAWDEVSSQVEQMIDDNASSTNVGEAVEELLDEYSRIKAGNGTPCAVGRAFERAVQNVSGTVDESLDTQKRLADLEHQVKTMLASMTDMGERAASVTPFRNRDSVV